MTRYNERRYEIIDVAAALFAAKGYDATSITDLGEAVGLGRGALYHYIGSKEDILAEIHDRAIAPLLTSASRILDQDLGGAVKVRLLSRCFLEVQFRLHNHSVVVLSEYRRLSGNQLSTYLGSLAQFESMLTRMLEEGRDDGTLQFDDLLAAKMAFLNLHIGTARWVDVNGPLTAADWSRRYCSILFDGLSSTPFAVIDDQTPDAAQILEIDLAET